MKRNSEWPAWGVAVLLALALTWPLASRPGSLGRSDSGDGRFAIWNVAWVAHALTTQPSALFDANIFHPHPRALAFSEANLVAGVMAVPVWLLTGNPHAAMNSVILACFALGYGLTHRLARLMGVGGAEAHFAALAYAFCPFLFSHLPHVQLLMSWTLPLAFLALHRFTDTDSWPRAFGLAASLAVGGLACAYYGVFAGLAIGWGVVWFGVTRRPTRPWMYWMKAAAAAAIAAALVAPFFLPYLDIRAAGFERTVNDARLHSADWRAYFASPMVLHRWMLPLLGSWKEVLFPGFLTLGFAGVAVASLLRRVHASAEGAAAGQPAAIGFYLSVALLSLWTSFGPDAGLYSVLHATVPVFSLLRAPSRVGLLVQLSLAILAAFGLRELLGAMAAGSRRRLAAATVLAAALAGSWAGPIAFVPAAPVPDVYRRVAALPRAPVAEFPFFSDTFDRSRHTEYMLWSIAHWQPLVNGYSDHLPAAAADDMRTLASFPSGEAWGTLDRRGVRYVVIHWRWMESAAAARIRASPTFTTRLRPIVDDPQVALYEVLAASRASRDSAAASVSSFLQNVNRTLVRPDAASR